MTGSDRDRDRALLCHWSGSVTVMFTGDSDGASVSQNLKSNLVAHFQVGPESPRRRLFRLHCVSPAALSSTAVTAVTALTVVTGKSSIRAQAVRPGGPAGHGRGHAVPVSDGHESD